MTGGTFIGKTSSAHHGLQLGKKGFKLMKEAKYLKRMYRLHKRRGVELSYRNWLRWLVATEGAYCRDSAERVLKKKLYC